MLCMFVRDEALLESMASCYGLPPEFNDSNRLIYRGNDPGARPKRLYTVSASVARILREDADENLRVYACGVRTFERQDAKFGAAGAMNLGQGGGHCGYRLCQEGLALMKPYVRRQLVRLTPEDFHHLVESRSVPTAEGTGRACFRDERSREGVRSLLLGCAVIVLDTAGLAEGVGLEEAQVLGQGGEPAVVGWKGLHSLSINMHKSEVLQMQEKMRIIVRLREAAGVGAGPVVPAGGVDAGEKGAGGVDAGGGDPGEGGAGEGEAGEGEAGGGDAKASEGEPGASPTTRADGE